IETVASSIGNPVAASVTWPDTTTGLCPHIALDVSASSRIAKGFTSRYSSSKFRFRRTRLRRAVVEWATRMKPSRGILAGFLLCAVLSAQTPSPPTAEVTSKDAPFTFKSGVNMVPVPVVVRDSGGHAVGNLGAGDFQLFDNGKPQMISKFSVEKLTND